MNFLFSCYKHPTNTIHTKIIIFFAVSSISHSIQFITSKKYFIALFLGNCNFFFSAWEYRTTGNFEGRYRFTMFSNISGPRVKTLTYFNQFSGECISFLASGVYPDMFALSLRKVTNTSHYFIFNSIFELLSDIFRTRHEKLPTGRKSQKRIVPRLPFSCIDNLKHYNSIYGLLGCSTV
jgi:hypothetical protein